MSRGKWSNDRIRPHRLQSLHSDADFVTLVKIAYEKDLTISMLINKLCKISIKEYINNPKEFMRKI